MRKRLVAVLLAVVLLLPAMLIRPQAAPADTVYVRKHVSFVYDNSGSMSEALDGAKNLKWTYASYAAQIFTGLLNDTDSLTLTLMNSNKGVKSLEVDLTGDRQKQVDKLCDITNYAKGGTPFNSVNDALKVLVKKGLLTDAQIGDNTTTKSEQFWLVLTTDGQFENGNKPREETERELAKLLKDYSNLHLVYFGIGAEGDNSDGAAIDFRNSTTLNAYPNFTAVYAEKQEQIVSTMQALANRISGRYSVTEGVTFNGNEVTLRISGESSPIRNIAVLAQKTNTKLLSAVDEDGKELIVARPANEQFPRNDNYDNIDKDTKGAHTALITSPEGKFQPGTVKLTFSEPVEQNEFSLMYEPAVYVRLAVEQKDASGNWVEVPYGQKVASGKPLRISYEICEDGTDTPLDAAKLPGVTTEQITCGDKEISKNGEFTVPAGNSTITATVSMMDGAYVVSATRMLQTISLEDYTFDVSGALSFYPDELAANTTQYIDFKVFYQGQPAAGDEITEFSVDGGDLQGTITTPDAGVFRFTPKQEGCKPGEMTVSLCFQGQRIASQNVIVKELVINYTAKAENDLTLFSNEVAANTKPVVFSVTKTKGNETSPLPEEEASDFRIEAVAADGTKLKGVTKYVGGQLHFITDDANAQAGEYTVTLYRQDAALATAQISVLLYNAQFTAEVFPVGDGKVDLLNLKKNESALAFVIYADGEPCTGTQLEGMLPSMLKLRHDAPGSVMKLRTSVGTYDGKAALLVRPTSVAWTSAGAWLKGANHLLLGLVEDGPLTVELTVVAEKGTQVSGSLEMIHDPMGVVAYVILMVALLVLLCILVYLVYCNLHKPRIREGFICYYKLKKIQGRYVMETKRSERIPWKFSFNTLPQEVNTGVGIVLRAPVSATSSLVCPASDPEAVIVYKNGELANYFYRTRGESSRRFLKKLQETAKGNKLLVDEVNTALGNPVMISRTAMKPNEKAEYTPKMSEQYFLARQNNEKKEEIEIWTFEGKQKKK